MKLGATACCHSSVPSPKNNYIASLQIVRQELARAYPMVLHMLMLDEMGVEIIAVWDATADYASTVPVSPNT